MKSPARPPRPRPGRRPHPLTVPRWVKPSMVAAGLVAPGVAAEFARRLFFHPPRMPRRDAERALLERGTHCRFDARGHAVHAWTWGDGPAVLLAHGWAGQAGQMTPFVEPLVEAGLRPVALDFPAHGDSTGRFSSLVHFTAAIEAATALFGPWHGIVAHSFGAAAATLALTWGLAARRAVFLAPPAQFESFWHRFRGATGVSDRVWRRVLTGAERWLELPLDRVQPLQLAPGLGHVGLLVLHSTDDRDVPIEESAELVARWPGARLDRLAGLGHLRLLRDPATVRQAVDFLVEPAARLSSTHGTHRPPSPSSVPVAQRSLPPPGAMDPGGQAQSTARTGEASSPTRRSGSATRR